MPSFTPTFTGSDRTNTPVKADYWYEIDKATGLMNVCVRLITTLVSAKKLRHKKRYERMMARGAKR